MPESKKPKENRESLPVTLPPAMKAKVMKEAEDRMIAPSMLVEKALERFLPTLPPINIPDAS